MPGPLDLFLSKLNPQADAVNSFQAFRELTKLKNINSLLQKTLSPPTKRNYMVTIRIFHQI